MGFEVWPLWDVARRNAAAKGCPKHGVALANQRRLECLGDEISLADSKDQGYIGTPNEGRTETPRLAELAPGDMRAEKFVATIASSAVVVAAAAAAVVVVAVAAAGCCSLLMPAAA